MNKKSNPRAMIFDAYGVSGRALLVKPMWSDMVMSLILPLIYADDPAGTAMFGDFLKRRDYFKSLS